MSAVESIRWPALQVALGLALAAAAGPLAAQDEMFDGLNRGAAVAGTQARRSSPAARDRRACLALQQQLAGAVEMYNLDYNLKVEKLDEALLRTLVEKGYLRELPEDPGWGPGSAGHYVLDDAGNGIACRVHGSASTVEPTDEQRCFATQKLIAGAVEMYNLDNNLKVEKLDEALLRTLVQKGYLEELPRDSGKGGASGNSYAFTSSGNVTCTVHGTPSGPSAAERRACYTVQRTLGGALEMYNLDKNLKIDKLDASVMNALVSGQYLRKLPEDPGQGPCSSNHYQLRASDGNITCTVHGSSVR